MSSRPEYTCLTRRLVRQDHNITLVGLPKFSGSTVCVPCGGSSCCDFIGEACGCRAPDCVDLDRFKEILGR